MTNGPNQWDGTEQRKEGMVYVLPQVFVYFFATGWSVFAALYIAAITWFPIPQTQIRFADTCLGFILGTLVSMIVSYFFGSSHRVPGTKVTDIRTAEKSSHSSS